MIPNAAMQQAASEEQILAVMDAQIAALRTRLESGEKIVALCNQGVNTLAKSPAATLANMSEVVGSIREALLCLLESNLLANRLSLNEVSGQCTQLEQARKQRSSPIHLGGFVPHTRRS